MCQHCSSASCGDCKPKIDWTKPIRAVYEESGKRINIFECRLLACDIKSTHDMTHAVAVKQGAVDSEAIWTVNKDGKTSTRWYIENVPPATSKFAVITIKKATPFGLYSYTYGRDQVSLEQCRINALQGQAIGTKIVNISEFELPA